MQRNAPTPCLVQINCSDFGSTAGIMMNISHQAQQAGFCSHMICAGKWKKRDKKQGVIYLDHLLEQGLQRKLNKLTGRYGRGFPLATRKLLRLLHKLQPDIVHLHNLHHHFFDIGRLFDYLKKNDIQVFWTLHDCWALTGHCAHYMSQHCDRWKHGCGHCPALAKYPSIYTDTTRTLYQEKLAWYGHMERLHLVAPSDWTACQIQQSFLAGHPVTIIKSGIDLKTFRPLASHFRHKYGLENDFIVLGVSAEWNQEKGLDVFIELSQMLPANSKIVLVGGDEQQVRQIPGSILWIPRTNSPQELAAIYTAADVFFNPTREEVLGLVNLEAQACGTPVVTFPSGGSPECVSPQSGVVLQTPDAASAALVLQAMQAGKLRFDPSECRRQAEGFAKENCFAAYVDMYKQAMRL